LGAPGRENTSIGVERLITRILSTHRGPVRRLRLGDVYHTSTSDTWFRSPALDKLEELHFRYKFMYGPGRKALPSSALRFSELRVASYGRCEFLEDLGRGATFPKLRELTLYQLRISDGALHALISACPALSSLFLGDNIGIHRVRISSPRLVRLGISVNERNPVMEERIIVNAPSMEKLLLFETDGGLKNIHVKFAPKLEVLGCLSSN
jgi:hypothetical protein